MARQLLQINFNPKMSRADYEETCRSLAQSFADVPGLLWKIWLIDDARSEAGGIYLFESEEALSRFLESPLAEAVRNDPGLSNFSAKPFGILEDVTATTRGPVAEAVGAQS